MARWTYAFSNGNITIGIEIDGLGGIDIDFIEVCPKCYEPLAVKETCYDRTERLLPLQRSLEDKVPGF